MKEFSKEFIEINGVEYTLFLNRTGIVAWEKYCKQEAEKIREMKEKYKDILNDNEGNIEITNDTNPFEGLEELENLDDDKELMTLQYKKLYWILLYTEHKLNIEEVSELYDQACKEYGELQLIQLGTQMIEDANTNPIQENQELKNLKALRPKKN